VSAGSAPHMRSHYLKSNMAPKLRSLVRELDFREHISKSWLFVSFVPRQKKGKPMRTRTRPLTQNLQLNMRLQTVY
jgi:hypothetical protein